MLLPPLPLSLEDRLVPLEEEEEDDMGGRESKSGGLVHVVVVPS